MKRAHRLRLVFTALLAIAAGLYSYYVNNPQVIVQPTTETIKAVSQARDLLQQIAVKGRAPKTGYERSQFGDGWASISGCDMRNIILARDLTEVTSNERCQVTAGVLNDPYTAQQIRFIRGPATSDDVQIDHVVALSNAWQTGAQQLSAEQRVALANDPLELLAVEGTANQVKSDGDAATWLPSNKAFRCEYVSRQIRVKHKYSLWVTPAEKEAIERVLVVCGG